MQKTYNSYKNGLQVSDLVTFMHNVFKNQFSGPRTALVIDRSFLFDNKTKYGIKKFFSYKMLDLNSNKIYVIKTRDIKVVKVFKSMKEEK
ncbi:MAG: hypothetical protein HOJ35_05415 [Bdellovibrionales bacterium]|jgi:hypothetical protein|nr:hypothetical protein [Bdellovibrionales bacterium]